MNARGKSSGHVQEALTWGHSEGIEEVLAPGDKDGAYQGIFVSLHPIG